MDSKIYKSDKLIPFGNRDTKYIIFDLDGTLIDSERIWLDSWGMVEKHLSVTVDNEFKKKVIGLSREELYPIISEKFPNNDFEIIQQIRRDYFSYSLNNNKIIPKQDVKAVLDILSKSGIDLYLCSNSYHTYVHKVLADNNLQHYFIDVFTREDVINGKPSPEIYNKMISKYNLIREEGFIVEDSSVGIDAAIKTSYRTIFIKDLTDISHEQKQGIHESFDSLLSFKKYIMD